MRTFLQPGTFRVFIYFALCRARARIILEIQILQEIVQRKIIIITILIIKFAYRMINQINEGLIFLGSE